MTMTTSSVPNYRFTNLSHLATALTHPSYKNEHKDWPYNHHENYEFVGDALLSNIVALTIFHLYPNLNEGELSKLRSSLVNEEMLSDLAKFLKLDQLLLVGNGDQNLASLDSVLANTFEAVLAAIYFDSHFESAKLWFENVTSAYSKDFFSLSNIANHDPKSKLQEYSMKTFKALPVYESIEKKIDKDTCFEVTLYLNSKRVGTVTDISKKKAEKNLANIALTQIMNQESLC